MYNEFVYVLKADKYYKIGRTNDVTRRIARLDIQLPFQVELFKVINTNDSVGLERAMHQEYESTRANGEWFELTERQVADIFLLPASIRWAGNMEKARGGLRSLYFPIKYEFEMLDLIEERTFEDSCPASADMGGYFGPNYLEDECPYPTEWVVADDEE